MILKGHRWRITLSAVLERRGALLGLLLSLVTTIAAEPPVPAPPPVPPAPPAGVAAPGNSAAPGSAGPGSAGPGSAGPEPGDRAGPGSAGPVGTAAPGFAAPDDSAVTAFAPAARPPGAPGPVEIPEQRSEAVTVFRHPNGSRTLVLSAGPIRLRTGGRWQPVDLTLHRDPDGGIRPATHPDVLWLSGGGRTADAAAVRGPDGTNTALAWDAPLPAPRLDGPRAIYPNARPGADLIIAATRTGFVASLESIGSPTHPRPQSAPAPTAPPGAPAPPTPANAPPFVAPADAAPSVVPENTPPSAAPANTPPSVVPATSVPEPAPATASPSVAPATPVPQAAPATSAPTIPPLTLRVTRPGGGHPGTGTNGTAAAVLPTAPGTASAEAAAAAMAGPAGSSTSRTVLSRVVAAAKPGASLPFTITVENTAADTDLSGEPDLSLGSYDGSTVARAFLSWDLSMLRGQRVIAATLRLYSTWSASCQAASWEVWSSPPVGPTTRWTNQPAGERVWATSTDTKGHDPHCRPGWTSVDLTELVRSWVQSGASSGTVLLRATNEQDRLSWKRFSSGAGTSVPALGVTVAP